MTTPLHNLHLSLLRPSVLHILRATGFHAARPSVIDALVDITSRYMLLLASRTSAHASLARNDPNQPTLSDVRLALQDVGALWPSMSAMEEQVQSLGKGGSGEKEDMRGIEAFLTWMTGANNREIRRIAEMETERGEPRTDTIVATMGPGANTAAMAEAEEAKEDFLTMLKKKHSKTGEESRYQGTVLGIPTEPRETKIEGGEVDDLWAWGNSSQGNNGDMGADNEAHQTGSIALGDSTTGSSPLTEIENV